MSTLSATLSTRDLRASLSEVVSRAAFGSERIGVTRNGKLAAVLVSPDDLALLEALEDAADLAAYRAAKAEDDGTRVPLDELLAELQA